jgi:hypothetical protein
MTFFFVFPSFHDNTHLYLLYLKYYEAVAWDQNTKVDPENEPNFKFSL